MINENSGTKEKQKMADPKLGQEQEKSKKIQKKKKRIIWPKNFDFNNPGPRPDPERWVPFNQRKKKGKGRKNQGMTRTQGGNVQAEKTMEMFTHQHSTAHQKTTQNKRKKKGRKR